MFCSSLTSCSMLFFTKKNMLCFFSVFGVHASASLWDSKDIDT